MPIDQPSLYIQRSSLLNVINGVGYILRKTGMDPFRINADSIISNAKKRASFNEQLEGTEEGLRELVKSINEEGKPNPFGALAIKALLDRTLYNRYKIEQVLQENQGIEQQEIQEPVFIVGMPRSGTTILHALLNEDSDHRSPLSWECLLPYPVPIPETYKDNDQLRTVKKEFDRLFKLVPDFLRKHYMAVDSPQECIGLNALDFNSFQFMAQLRLPSYLDWFNIKADKAATMRFHKRFLQYLQSGGVKSKRWLLKSPVHLMRLPELFEVYPDAKIIMTHRHPSQVVPSTASLITTVRSLYSDNEIPELTGKEQAKIWSGYLNKFLDSLESVDKNNQIIHIRFEDFVSDPVDTARNIYQQFDWPLSKEVLDNFSHFLVKNPKEKHGTHDYSLSDFGLLDQDINEMYSKYLEFLNQLYSSPHYGT